MHESSFNLMQRFSVNVPVDAKVLDIGALDVNGSLRELFWGGYVGCDVVAGPNVDLVMVDPYVIPLPNESVDVVVSTSCLEHVAMPWILVLEIDRVLKPGGRLAITVPWRGVHHCPPDYWRISHEGISLLFGAWMLTSGRKPYVEQDVFVTEPSPENKFMDTYFEARKP